MSSTPIEPARLALQTFRTPLRRSFSSTRTPLALAHSHSVTLPLQLRMALIASIHKSHCWHRRRQKALSLSTSFCTPHPVSSAEAITQIPISTELLHSMRGSRSLKFAHEAGAGSISGACGSHWQGKVAKAESRANVRSAQDIERKGQPGNRQKEQRRSP